jgi:aryl-alcohol dehydrogenase-like predicted oxidoreductase
MRNGEVPFELLDAVFAAGINTFDTAESYDLAELTLGEWIRSRNLRDKVIILSKGARKNRWRNRVSPYDIESDFETSRAKLGYEFIDIYLLHQDDPSSPVGPIMETLNRFHREGGVGAIGCSNWHWRRVEAANTYAKEHGLLPFTISSPNFGLAVKHDDPGASGTTLTGEDNREARDWFLREKMPIFAYSSLGRGFFAGKVSGDHPEAAAEQLPPLTAKEYAYPDNFERLRRCELLAREKGLSPAQIAFAWVFTQPLNVFPITSPSSLEHLRETVAALSVNLTAHEAAWLNLDKDR